MILVVSELRNQAEPRLDGKPRTFREWVRVGADTLLLVVMMNPPCQKAARV
jgi:hypothetical protein